MPTTQHAADYDERVISAAREVFAQQGFAAPVSEIAELAGVGVASIYRRYPNKRRLAEQVRIAAMSRVVAEAESARETEPDDPWAAFVRFMRGCLRAHAGIGVVLPPYEESADVSEDFTRLRQRMIELIEELVSTAQRAGQLRDELRSADVFLLFKHLNPPLATDEERRAELRQRYLELLLPGLRERADRLPGDAPEWDELFRMCVPGGQ